jgi:2-hydroxychromene-2-carboxylate isomerase
VSAPAARAERAAPGSIVVAIDFKQPQSYLALGPTLGLAAACGVAIDWRPFAGRPLERPSAEGRRLGADDRTARHLRFRARYFERDIERYASAQGLVLRDLYRAPDVSVAGMGLLFAKRTSAPAGAASIGGAPGLVDAYVDRVFTGYWSGDLDIEDVAAIRGVLATVGADAGRFDPAALRDEYERSLTALREAGVIGAPAYLVGDELFIGRAHLPMIRWLLDGKAGSPPI